MSKTFYVSIDSLNTLRNRRNSEATSPSDIVDDSPNAEGPANLMANPAEVLRHTIDRLEARTAEATELRIRLELTERTQSSLEEELREERRRREEAEMRAADLERQLEAPREPQDKAESAEPRSDRVETSEATEEPEKGAERPWWRRLGQIA